MHSPRPTDLVLPAEDALQTPPDCCDVSSPLSVASTECPASEPGEGCPDSMCGSAKDVPTAAVGPGCSGADVSTETMDVLFLDWDDTLFPTSVVLDDWGLRRRPFESTLVDLGDERAELLRYLDDTLYDFLGSACRRCDDVVILTNARHTWVELLIDRFVPSVRDLMEPAVGRATLRVCYARELYRKDVQSRLDFPISPAWTTAPLEGDELEMTYFVWKRTAVQRILRRSLKKGCAASITKNIVGIGDSLYESSALQELNYTRIGDEMGPKLLKTITCGARPSFGQLIERLFYLTQLLPVFLEQRADFDIEVETMPWEEQVNALSEKFEQKIVIVCDDF